MRMCQIIFDAMFRSSHEHDRCRVIILLVLNSIGPTWSIRQPGVLNKCEVQGQEDLQLGRCRVVATDRTRTKSNRTDLVLSSPTFATMAWPRGWPSSTPSMSSTRGHDLSSKACSFLGLGRCRLRIVGVVRVQNCRRCACAGSRVVRVEYRSRAPGELVITFLYQGGQTDIVALASRRSDRRAGSS